MADTNDDEDYEDKKVKAADSDEEGDEEGDKEDDDEDDEEDDEDNGSFD